SEFWARPSEFVTVLVRDPRTQKEDSWHSHIDYEIFIHWFTTFCPGDRFHIANI
uniref:Uncharacterized protein n=1 Tax=Chelonoidis abingdonii TaxID=106734 RepID=A0A8C0FW03_CHEAB